jgi:hypothetical protein
MRIRYDKVVYLYKIVAVGYSESNIEAAVFAPHEHGR